MNALDYDLSANREKLEEKLRNELGIDERSLKLLNGFFELYKPPVDIAIILYGGLNHAYTLANYIKDNNILFYKPRISYHRKLQNPVLEGEPNPERTLLLFDADMLTGKVLQETSDYFENLGYKRERIFAFLQYGIAHRTKEAQLKHVDVLISMRLKP